VVRDADAADALVIVPCGSQRVNPVSAAETVRAEGNRISGSGSMSRVTRSDTSDGTSGRTRRTVGRFGAYHTTLRSID
jgi:hypothetical protein